MKFSIGDKIVLKHTGEEGVVIDYIGKDMLEVAVNGTHFPVYADEVDHPYLQWFVEKNAKKKKPSLPEQLPVEKKQQAAPRLPRGVYLSFLPVFRAEDFEDIVDHLRIHLINELPVPVRFRYDMRVAGESAFRHEGILHPYGNLFLHTVVYGDMNDQPRFHWELSDVNNQQFRVEEGIVRIKPQRLFEHISELLQKNEPTFSYKLVEDFVERPKATAPVIPVTPPTPQKSKPAVLTSLQDLPRSEVDLHIEALVEDRKGWSNAAIMELQLRTLEKYLHLAVAHRMERLIVIHGVGSGALKEAVHRVLRQHPEVYRFKNEWMGKYGYGATEVIFRK